jgi:GMP synthase (glutamine-hydrolysing)
MIDDMPGGDLRIGGIAILDFGSQYTQLIARRVREQGVYAEVFPNDVTMEELNQHEPRGYILSGGPTSIYAPGAPHLPLQVLEEDRPLLGICYGMQLLAHVTGGTVAPGKTRQYGSAQVHRAVADDPLFAALPEHISVWMSHSDHVAELPPGFSVLAKADSGMLAAIGDPSRHRYGVQFHPEVNHTPQGVDLIRNFVFDICGCEARWSPAAFIDDVVERLHEHIGAERVLLGLSGGVDSAVTAAILHQAIGDQLTCVFVNTGMLRQGEADEVVQVFQVQQGMNLIAVDATELFLDKLMGVTDPEAKRKIIGGLFIDVFIREARRLSEQGVRFLAQGTIYPDVIESARGHRTAKTIKTHHNVGGLPDDLDFELVEPLRDLFKDEVRKVGLALGLPDHIVWRQPFPGPGLGVRCVGEITWERLEALRRADAIFREELEIAGLLAGETAQCFAVLLPVKSVGVMGDNRTYEEVVALRAVTTDDFMTADWARLPYDLLARVSNRIVNHVPGINRVVYDVTSKPPGTIEWE